MASQPSSPRVLLPPRIAMEGDAPDGVVLQLEGACMGTTWRARVVAEGHEQARALQAGIAAVLEEIEAQMSHFRPASPLRRFGELAAGEWMPLSPQFAQVMRAALSVAQASDGAFDPAAAALIEAWGFGAGQRFVDAGFAPPAVAPSPSACWRRLQLDAQDRLRQPGGVALNLAAIAKGFAVDAVSRWLAQQGYAHHLVEVGGELRGTGMKPDLQPWWVALEAPADNCDLPATRIALHGLAVATSGDYRRSYHHAGRRLQHTIDPRSGAPVRHTLAAVSVVHEECMLADAWATAIMVLGPRDGLALAEQQGLRALLQWPDETGRWQEASSAAFNALVAEPEHA
ncbi:FAD:protein FMN transferase [Viridibacterium curvum]|uniref:FAD:protein FMN transferase n=1 Tax=Viridibacterium curvum TaxID=1101404 RepID=A0ABP9QSS8_9RHOO